VQFLKMCFGFKIVVFFGEGTGTGMQENADDNQHDQNPDDCPAGFII